MTFAWREPGSIVASHHAGQPIPSRDVVGVVLAGGFGTRLRTVVNDRPKPLVPVRNRPFIEWVLDFLRLEGVTDTVVSAGHMANVVESYFQTRPADGMRIRVIRETEPLGTGGATHFAWNTVSGRDILVVNGDSLLLADFAPLWSMAANRAVDGVIVGIHQPDASRYGTLNFDHDHRLVSFEEKKPGAGVVNAGIYFLRSRLMTLFDTERPLSIERDVFPKLLRNGCHLAVCPLDGRFLDIGTPDSLAQADNFLPQTPFETGNL